MPPGLRRSPTKSFIRQIERGSLAACSTIVGPSRCRPRSFEKRTRFAAKVAALDHLADRRRAVDEECDGLEARVELLRDRIFEARREPAKTSAVTAQADALWMRVDELRRNLRAALQEVRGLSVGLTKRAEPRPPPSPDSDTGARALRSHAKVRSARSRGRGRPAEWLCFWRWPFGHAWEPVAETNVAYLRCVECGKASDVRFRAPASTHADRWGPGGSG